METSTQFQTNVTNKSTVEPSINVVRKAQALVSTPLSSSSNNAINTSTNLPTTNVVITGGGTNESITQSITQAINQSIQKVNSIASNSNPSIKATGTATNLLKASTNAQTNAVVSNGQATPTQQIIQVSSQGAIMSGQQLMQIQAVASRHPIQLRTGQQISQIQLIPYIQGQNQRPVIIQQTPGNVQLHSPATTITSMANLAHNNVGKITSVNTVTANTVTAHQKPVIIQQSATGQFIHSTNAQPHSHNATTKITTVGRHTANRPTQSKVVLGLATQNHHQTTAVATTGTSVANNHTTLHTGVLTTANQPNHLSNNNTANNVNCNSTLTANPQQLTRYNIISQLPGVHTSVSNVQQHATGKPLLSLATALNKPLIINSASSVVQPANLMPVMTLTTLTTSSGTLPGRHTMITTNNTQFNQQFNQISSVSTSPLANNSGQLIINSSNANQTNLNQTPQQTQHLSSIANNLSQQQQPTAQLNSQPHSNSLNSVQQLTSTIRSSNTLNSPIKQQLPHTTPSSPRPSILIRKRVGTPLDLESKLNYQSPSPSINSNNSANTKNSQLNSVKQNLSLKYNATGSLSSSNQLSNTQTNLKNAQDLLNNRNQSTINKKQSTNIVNNTFKKSNLDNSSIGANISNLTSSQTIKNENEQIKQHPQDSTNQLITNNTTSTNFNNNNNLSVNNNSNNNNSSSTTTGTDNRQITPRKRRKQLLEPFMLTTSQNVKLLNDDSNSSNLLCNEEMRKKDNTINYHSTNNALSNGICRRPRPSLLSSYNLTWKSLQYHFLRHAEVKLKTEKKINLQDLTNETLKKRNSWKVNHLSAQLEDILECEISFNQKLKELSKMYSENKNLLPPKIKELGNQPFNAKVCHNSISVLDKLTDLFAANVQRSNLFHDQIKDTNNLLNKLSNDHNDKVNRMTKKFLNNKRNASVKV